MAYKTNIMDEEVGVCRAKALLMGMHYRVDGHYYYSIGLLENRKYLCADTMEELTQSEAWDRLP